MTFEMRHAIHAVLIFGYGCLVPVIAFAHIGQGDISGGLLAGFRHPVSGLGVPIPGIEVGIALSALALGAAVALALTPPLWIAGLLVALFAICHGHAHGAELPGSANAMTYAIGFVAATGTLHAIGILTGTVNRWKAGGYALRAGGALISGCGVYFLTYAIRGA